MQSALSVGTHNTLPSHDQQCKLDTGILATDCEMVLFKSQFILLAMATITFSKRKYAATKRGWLLNFCRDPKQWCLYGTCVSEVVNQQPLCNS